MYLDLYHGRTDIDQDMEDWGTEGPVFGPLAAVHVTYVSNIMLQLPNGDLQFLAVDKDMVFYDGVYYGDYKVTGVENTPEWVKDRCVPYEEAKAALPA